MTQTPTAKARLESQTSVWRLKEITYPPGTRTQFKIVTQNRNGPCSLIALCNILILRGDIRIEPSGRREASYEYLSSLVGDFLLISSGDIQTESQTESLAAALSILPKTQYGMDLNPIFTGISSFRATETADGDGGELKLFELCAVRLVHGWLADPASPEYSTIARAQDYDNSLNMIVAGETQDVSLDSNTSTLHDEEAVKRVQDAYIIRHFLDTNSTQLTYHGLFSLSALDPGLFAFIRNSHLSVLYVRHGLDKGPGVGDGDGPSLWTLVTDSNFATEPSVVWESLEDVDGAASRFVDADLIASSTAGGDFAGQTAEAALLASTNHNIDTTVYVDNDLALAQQLQAEEEERELERQTRDIDRETRRLEALQLSSPPPRQQRAHDRISMPDQRVQPPPTRPGVGISAREGSLKRKKDCIIM